MRLPALYAMRQNARWRQCTMSSGPQSNATHHGSEKRRRVGEPDDRGDEHRGFGRRRPLAREEGELVEAERDEHAPSRSTGHTDGKRRARHRERPTAAVAPTAKTDHAYHRTGRDSTPRGTGVEVPAGSAPRDPARHDRRRPATRCDGRCPSPSRSPAAPSAAPSPCVRAARRRPCSAPTLGGRAQGCR